MRRTRGTSDDDDDDDDDDYVESRTRSRPRSRPRQRRRRWTRDYDDDDDSLLEPLADRLLRFRRDDDDDVTRSTLAHWPLSHVSRDGGTPTPGTASRGGHIVVDLLDDDDDDDDDDTADGAPMNIFERFVANGDDHDDDDDDAAVIDSDAQIIVPVQDVLKARDIDEGVARLNAAWRGVWPVAPGDLYPFDEYATVAFVRAVRRIQDIRYGDDAIVRDIPSDLMGHVPLTKKSFMNVLRTDEWLNDEVIDAFGALLQHHYKNTMYATLVLPSYIWKDQAGQSTNLRRYIQKATPFLRDFPESSVILAPIHHNLHWALLAIFADKGKAVFYNSMSAGWSTFAGKQQQLIFKDLLQLLVPLFPALEPRANRRRVTPDDVRLPQQRDGASCGLYVMHAMHCLAVSVHETAFAPSTWEHKLPYIRMHLALSLWLASPPLLFDEEAYVLY